MGIPKYKISDKIRCKCEKSAWPCIVGEIVVVIVRKVNLYFIDTAVGVDDCYEWVYTKDNAYTGYWIPETDVIQTEN